MNNPASGISGGALFGGQSICGQGRHGPVHPRRRDRRHGQPLSRLQRGATAPTTSPGRANCRQRICRLHGAGTFAQTAAARNTVSATFISATASGRGTYNSSGTGQISGTVRVRGRCRLRDLYPVRAAPIRFPPGAGPYRSAPLPARRDVHSYRQRSIVGARTSTLAAPALEASPRRAGRTPISVRCTSVGAPAVTARTD